MDYSEEKQTKRPKQAPKFWLGGLGLLFFGVTILLIGLFDLAWTLGRYSTNCQLNEAMCTSNHIFTYIASPLWGGIILIINGGVGLHMPRVKHVRHTRCYSIYTKMLFASLLSALAITVLNSLETYYGLGHFWSFVNGNMTAYDSVKLSLPFAISLLSVVALKIVCFLLFTICCGRRCSSDPRQRGFESDDLSQQSADYRRQSRDDRRPTPASRGYMRDSWRKMRNGNGGLSYNPYRYRDDKYFNRPSDYNDGYRGSRYAENNSPRRHYYN